MPENMAMIYTLKLIKFLLLSLATFKVLCGLWEPATCVSQSIDENHKKEKLGEFMKDFALRLSFF